MQKRHQTYESTVGSVKIGGSSKIVIQSMTDTDTADIKSTVNQTIELVEAGSEIVRMTVNNDEAANAVPYIKQELIEKGFNVPLVGCFHYNGHLLLKKYPSCAQALDKYRINPGNVGFGNKKDKNFISIIETALYHDAKKTDPFHDIYHPKAIRIGANWGSLDKEVLDDLYKKNEQSKNPIDYNELIREAIVLSVLQSAKLAEEAGFSKNQIILSCKTSRPTDLIKIYQKLAERSNYALHLGLTEAGSDQDGAIKTASALSVLLYQGYGDTIRVSTTNVNLPRTYEVQVCKQILQALDLQSFSPSITSCPGCGRTNNTYFKNLTQKIQEYVSTKEKEWKKKYSKTNTLKIAVMGCIVNGPGESKHADIGISLPGNAEQPTAVVFVDGKQYRTLHYDDNIENSFKKIIDEYIETRKDIEECVS